MVYHDFLKSRNLHQQIRRITLVHPSEACLKRGALHAHLFFPQAGLRLVCKSVNQLRAEDLSTDPQGAKLHLLMNIRNIDSVSAINLSKLIQVHMQGYNQFVCLSPFYGDLSETTARLDAFVDSLTAGAGTFFSENLKAGQLVEGKPWTCAMRIFAAGHVEEDGFENLSRPEEAPARESLHETREAEAPAESEISRAFEPEEPDSVRQLRILAEMGSVKAQNNLGFIYEIGQDVPKDDAEAVKWFCRAAEQGHAKAQYNLANHYALGRGTAQNDEAAARWYLRAAEQGIANAMNHLGAMYAAGRGVEKDEAESIKWYTRAAGQGDGYALRILRKKFLFSDTAGLKTGSLNCSGENSGEHTRHI
jgi:hypothetical protein